MKNKQAFVPYNFDLYSIIKPKVNSYNKTKNNMIISQMPISYNKKQHNNSINLKKPASFSSKLFFNFALNPKKKAYKKTISLNKGKSKEEYSNDYSNIKENNNIKKNAQVITIEIDMINKMINDNNNNIEQLIKSSDDLNIQKNNNQKILENNLSKKETLEEMTKSIINYIKTNNDLNNEIYNIEITLEEIKNNNKESFTNKVFHVFNYINNYHDNKFLNFISITINKAYLDFYLHLTGNAEYNSSILINNFFYSITLPISSQILCETSDKSINILLRFILKINIISENIDKVIHFLEYDYKEQKKDITNKIDDLENKKLSLQLKKKKLIECKESIDESNEISSQKKYPFQKKINKNEFLVNKNNTSNIRCSTEFVDNSISNSNDKVKLLNGSSNKTKDNNNNMNQKKKSCRNMLKFINKKSKTDYTAYHSNKISEDRIRINGISNNCSYEKNTKNIKKINLKDANKKNRISGWTQRKEKNESGSYLVIKKKIQNGLGLDLNERNNINKTIKDYSQFHNLTENNVNNNSKIIKNQYNHKTNNNNLNGKKLYNMEMIKIKENIIINKNNYSKIKNIRTERIKELQNKGKTTINIKNSDKNTLNNSQTPINNIVRNNLSKNRCLYDNISFEKNKKKTLNANNGNNFLNQYLTNKNNYRYINNKNNNNIYYQRIKKLSINRKNIKKQTLNKEMPKRKNSSKTHEKLEKIDINNQNNYNNISMESFCYYRLLEDNSKLFNPLNDIINFKQLGYNEGFISFDSNSKSIVIGSNNIFSDKNNNNIELYYKNVEESDTTSCTKKINAIKIQLKDITKIYLDKLMQNIIKIHNIFLKYIYNNQNNDNGISPKKLSNINKLINIREIMNIKDMEQNEKIKAGLCNFFSFVIEFNNSKRIECILINFYQFNTWLNYLEDIVNINKSVKFIANGNNSDSKNKINGIFKLKSMYSNMKSRQVENIQRSITEEKSKIY